ncbi:hypothetical protein I6F26_33650 [Ensifer sp. IC3342]|nr:hypothetical protein [Ensifer sp. BRP08]MCA1451358.1 hypothetical protein [Ensifer sp. IC3342]
MAKNNRFSLSEYTDMNELGSRTQANGSIILLLSFRLAFPDFEHANVILGERRDTSRAAGPASLFNGRLPPIHGGKSDTGVIVLEFCLPPSEPNPHSL